MLLYILLCERNKYYIGSTERKFLIRHLKGHRDGKRCNWTKKYNAIKLLKTMTVQDDDEVTEITIQWMKKKGIQNVRGGDFDKFRLTEQDIERIKDGESNAEHSESYEYNIKQVDNRPTPGMTWHFIPN